MTPLQKFLNQLHGRFHAIGYLESDPLEFVHHYTDPWDQECVALLAALLAYGNVKQIRRSVADLLARIHSVAEGPADFVRRLGEPRPSRSFNAKADAVLRGFVHRFNVGEDLGALLRLLSRSWREHGSLGAHFLSFLEPSAPHIGDALTGLIAEWRTWIADDRVPPPESFGYLLTSPASGSCCKRWCMFLRWMGRKDALDPGLWTRGSGLSQTFPNKRALRSSQLILPLDTHTGRISQYLGLTPRKSLGWLAALEITEALRACDPADPTRYDFALSRLGILDLCQRTYRREICTECDLIEVCQLARQKASA